MNTRHRNRGHMLSDRAWSVMAVAGWIAVFLLIVLQGLIEAAGLLLAVAIASALGLVIGALIGMAWSAVHG